LSGDYGSQVALQYGGHLTSAVAVDAGQEVGEVPAWSLGNFVPRVTCENDNLMMCICEGKGNVKLDEPACRIGPECSLPLIPTEWPSEISESEPSLARDHALGRVKSDKETDPEYERMRSVMKQNYCTYIAKPARAPIPKRVSLGSARCEDVNPKQCGLFYTKQGENWHHCESFISPKQCKAKVVKEETVQDNSKGIDAWGAKHAFVPGAWPVHIDADGTVTAEKKPSIEVFEKYADHLPPRTLKAYKL
jgi:hypothetical protein